VTAFRGLSDFVPSTRQEAGVISEWQQTRGQLLVGGNSKTIRVWDAGKDASTQVGRFPALFAYCLDEL